MSYICKKCKRHYADDDRAEKDICWDCWDDQIRRSMMWHEWREGWRGLFSLCIRKAPFDEQNWYVPTWQKPLYILKAAILLLLFRSGGFDYSEDKIDVVRTHYATLYAGWQGRWLTVGKGLRGWKYEITRDGDWNM